MTRRCVQGGRKARFHGLLLEAAGTLLPSGLGRLADAVGWLSDGTLLVEFDDGRAIRVRLDDGYWVPAAFARLHEPEVAQSLLRFFRPDTYFVDGRANIGWWSVFAAARLGADRVVATEPAPRAYGQLEDNSELNRGLRTLQAAVWSEVGSLETAVDARRHEWASTSEWDREGLYRSGFRREHVPAVTIDRLGLPRTHAVIKMDVEGAEEQALRGATETLRETAWSCSRSMGATEVPTRPITSVDSAFAWSPVMGRPTIALILPAAITTWPTGHSARTLLATS